MSANLIELGTSKKHAQGFDIKPYVISIASTPLQLQTCQRLRYSIFADELGVDIRSSDKMDQDRFDPHCTHLMVTDTRTHQVVATTRLLSGYDAKKLGSFYSESEFDLGIILELPGKFLEVGRTCIHQNYRKGSVLALLWKGIASIINLRKIDYLIGCASIPADSREYLIQTMAFLRQNHFSSPDFRVKPYTPLDLSIDNNVTTINSKLPPLLKGYVRQGAVICGEPCFDPDFNVADVFVFLNCNAIAERYVNHFLERFQSATN